MVTTGLVLLDKILIAANLIECACKVGSLITKALSSKKRAVPLGRRGRSYA
jgi:hypothetical protein